LSAALVLVVVAVIVVRRQYIWNELQVLRGANPAWLLAALGLVLLGFFCASQVYQIALRQLGYRFSPLRLWGTAIVAIMLSQSVPAGGIASYAFIVESLRRRGVSAGHAALVAALEGVSYICGMVLYFGFALAFITVRSGTGAAEELSFGAAVAALAVIGAALFVLTRRQAVIERWLLAPWRGLARLLRRKWSDAPVLRLAEELARGRALMSQRPLEMLMLVGVQLASLTCHSLAMLAVLYSLNAPTSLFVVMAGFGITLLASTFNVLPGGGGTVETALAITLGQLGVGQAALAAALIFRIVNFWLIAAPAILCYRWLMRRGVEGKGQREKAKA
jgi:uncharacterized protein (TIRG00374 family)